MLKRYAIVIGLLLCMAVLSNTLSYDIFYKQEKTLEIFDTIPLKIGSWRGYNLAVEDNVYRILETKSIIHRIYRSHGNEVFLSIVYYPETKVDFHDPGGCLGGRGIEIHRFKKQITFDYHGKPIVVDLNQIIWKKADEEQLVYYFYRAGGYLGPNYIKLRFFLAENKLLRADKSGSLIRISTHVHNSDYSKASEILTDFISKLYPSILAIS